MLLQKQGIRQGFLCFRVCVADFATARLAGMLTVAAVVLLVLVHGCCMSGLLDELRQ